PRYTSPLSLHAALPSYPSPTGTSFLDAFQSCLLMKLGANRRMNASCLACPGRISSAPASSDANDCFTNSSVVITLMPPSASSVRSEEHTSELQSPDHLV